MNSFFIFLQAMVVGFAIAAPVGPIGILCIKRTLSGGFWSGMVTGLGSSIAGALYGTLVVFGITATTAFIASEIFWIKLLGGFVLIMLGVRELWVLRNHTLSFTPAESSTLLKALGSAFFIALSNPMTVIGYFSMVPVLAANFCCTPAQGAVLVSGIFAGSMAWWLLLSAGIATTRRRISPTVLSLINRGAGVILIGFGLFILISVALS